MHIAMSGLQSHRYSVTYETNKSLMNENMQGRDCPPSFAQSGMVAAAALARYAMPDHKLGRCTAHFLLAM